MLDLLQNDVTGRILDTHIAKFFDTCAGIDRLLKKLFTLSSFMAPITTFLQRKTNTTIDDKYIVVAKVSKMEPMAGREVCGSVIEEHPGQSGS